MANEKAPEETDDPQTYLDDIDADGLADDERLAPTPEQHERLKNELHGERLKQIKRSDRRYLVVGRGDGDAGDRRLRVCELLDSRIAATAYRLEDFGFTGEELDLWAPAFEILSEMATRIVGILEDYDGGHVWELGFLYHYQTQIRNSLWILKRRYSTAEEMRERYDNGMAASHLAALENAVGDRVIQWDAPAELPDAVAAIP